MIDDKVNNLKDNLEKAIKDADSIHETIMNKLDDFADTLKGVEISIAELPDKLTQRFDERYASKKYEKVLDKIGMYVILAVVGALLALVMIQ